MPALRRLEDVADRFELIVAPVASPVETFAEHVRRSLGQPARALAPHFLYDELGSILFEAICRLPEYYVTRAEEEILDRKVGEMVRCLPAPLRLLELGSGSGRKAERFIDAALERQSGLEFVAIDVSRSALEASGKRLLGRFPDLRMTACHGSYENGLRNLSPQVSEGVTTLALFLGSSIGNLDFDDAVGLLRAVRQAVGPDGALVLGTDLKKPSEILLAAYDDALGVTRAFNLNLLVRINRELRADFDVRRFRHVALYDERRGRVEMHIESELDQTVRIEALDLELRFRRGERIHTENSYKYDTEDIEALARGSGFSLERAWTDGNGWFSCNLLRAQGAG